tara:strand:- start:8674 stop:9759 length:1086 start_codon:yes stop_codon:yes gene_type:complete
MAITRARRKSAFGNDADPNIILEPSNLSVTPVSGSTDSANTIMLAKDPEGFPITYDVNYWDSSTTTFYKNDSSNLPPHLLHPAQITDSAGTGKYRFLTRSTDSDGSGNSTTNQLKLRYTASDGIRTSTSIKTFKLNFGAQLWRIFVQSGSAWGSSYWDHENEDNGDMGWITDNSTSNNNNKNIIAGTVSGYGSELTPIADDASLAAGKYGFWRGSDDLFSGTKHTFSSENVTKDWFKTAGTSNARQYINTASAGATADDSLSGGRDYIFFYFTTALKDDKIAGTYLRFDTFSGGRPDRRPSGTVLLQYYDGTLGSNYNVANWVTWCSLNMDFGNNGGSGGNYSKYYFGPLVKGATLTATNF